MSNKALIGLLNRWWNAVNEPKSAVLGELDLSPSQSDKPSNHSSHVLTEEYRKAKLFYSGTQGYRVSTVANTNSMEPLFDDNCVVVLEKLRGGWTHRLKTQPLTAGDVVTYDTNVGSIIHVLKYKTKFLGQPAWILQGTNNFLPDMSKVLESQIKERLYAVIYCKSKRKND